MRFTPEKLTFTVPLTLKAHQLAQKFYQHQSHQEKAKQVYLNTLAVYAANFYLGCLGIETDLKASDSQNTLMQTFGNIADLEIKGKGKIECRYVLPDSKIVEIPAETWSDRIGYVAIQFDRELTEAKLLGFLPKVPEEVEELSLENFQSLEDMLEYLQEEKQALNLSTWLYENVFAPGWQSLETLLQPQQLDLAFRMRTSKIIASNTVKESVERCKLICLEKTGEEMALCVAMQQSVEGEEIKIWVELYPRGEKNYLPVGIKLMILDEEGTAVMLAETRNNKSIQFDFTGEPGEHFMVKVACDDISITEHFIV